MNRVFLLSILIHWYPFLLVRSSSSSSSYFNFDKHLLQESHYTNKTFSIGGTFNLPSTYKCSDSPCLTNLKLTLKNDKKLSINLWCDSPATLILNKSNQTEESSCVLGRVNATARGYRLSATVQVNSAGSLIPVFSATFPNDPDANQEWSSEEIVIDEQQHDKLRTIQRNKRQVNDLDDTNIQMTAVQDGSIDDGNGGQIQMMVPSDTPNVMNQPTQLNTYTGTSSSGHTADLTCNGAGSCPDYPKTDEQGRTICCFVLPQMPNGITALSSVIYQNGVQNLNDFQVNIDNGQSFNAANDLSVFLGSVIPASQCNVILPAGATQPVNAQFRLTWTYNSNSADNNPSPTTMADGTLPVNVLRVTSTSASVQQADQYNEWFVCPPSQDGRISLLQSIAILSGDNIDYFRCIYVNNQSIPLNDPTNAQLLVFSSSKNSPADNPSITTLPAVHTDCISIQFFPTTGNSINLASILLGITIAFQTASSTDMSSSMPQVSDLQGTSQIAIDITVNISSSDDYNIAQTPLPSATDTSNQCIPYEFDVPMSYNSSSGTYDGTFDISAQNSQQTILQSITVTSPSSAVGNQITMVMVDNQGNTLSPPLNLLFATPLPVGEARPLSKIILQVIPMQDAAMDSTIHAAILLCPINTQPVAPPSFATNPSISNTPTTTVVIPMAPLISNQLPTQIDPSMQTYNGPTVPPISNIVPSSVSSDPALNCQERTSSTYGTYPPDLSALTIPTKKPPKTFTTKSTMIPSPTSHQSLTVQMLPDHTCFDQISFSNNPFLYDIIISTSDYTNSVDCLSPTSGCSVTFANANKPKITLLFTAPACISYLRVLSPSNVQQFSYAMYDEDGIQIPLPGASDNQGTLLSSSGVDPLVQLNQYSCGYSVIVQLLTTSDNGPATAVTIDTGGCFKNLSATTTTMAPIPSPNNVLPSFSQQMPSFVPAPSYAQPVAFAPSPMYAPSPMAPMAPSPFLPPPSPVEQQSLPLVQPYPSSASSQAPFSPPSQMQYFPAPPSPSLPFVPAPAPIPSPIAPQMPAPPPSQTTFAPPVVPIPSQSPVPPPPPLPFQSIPVSSLLSPSSPAQLPPSPMMLPPAPPPFQSILASAVLSTPSPPPSPSLSLVSSSILQMPPSPSPYQTTFASPILPPPSPPSAPVAFQSPPPAPFQSVVPAPIFSSPPSSLSASLPPQIPLVSPTMPVPPYSPPPPPVINPSPVYQAPPMAPPLPPQQLPFPIVPDTTTQAPTPLICSNNGPPMQLILGSPCVSQMFTSDSNVLVDLNINPGGQGIIFRSNVPINITVQFSCVIQMMYMCNTGSTTNVGSFSYTLQDISNNPVASGSVNQYGTNQCNPRPLSVTNPVTQLIITISQTNDAQSPRNVVLDLQGCYVSTIPTQPPSVAVTPTTTPAFWPVPVQPSPQFIAPAPPPYQPQSPAPLQTAPIPVPIQMFSPSPQTSAATVTPPPVQTTTYFNTDITPPSMSNCVNNIPLDNTNYISNVQTSHASSCNDPIGDLNINGNGCRFNVLPSTAPVQFSMEFSFPATLTSISTGSQTNVNAFTVHLFDSSGQLITPDTGTNAGYTSTIVNGVPTVTGISNVLAASFNISVLSTTDGQAPNGVTFGLMACFPSTMNSTDSPMPVNACPQISLTSHPNVDLIVFSDGTNVTNDLDPNGNGCNLVSLGTIMTVLLRNGMPATFSSVGVSSPNVNQIDVALFDEASNRPLIQSPQGTTRSPFTLNPSIQNLSPNPAATLAVTFLSTTDGQPPRNVKLIVYACFSTTSVISPTNPSQEQSARYSPQTSMNNTPSQQPTIQTNQYNQQYQSPSVGPTNICIDPSQPAQVTSVANTPLPREYYSSNQCVCICQAGIIIPTSSGVIQYNPSSPSIPVKAYVQRQRKRRSPKN